jgi:uncharacterized membrane protein YeiB
MSEVSRELLVGGLVFVAIAGLGAYWLAREALGPVERLRRQVAARSGATSSRTSRYRTRGTRSPRWPAR